MNSISIIILIVIAIMLLPVIGYALYHDVKYAKLLKKIEQTLKDVEKQNEIIKKQAENLRKAIKK